MTLLRGIYILTALVLSNSMCFGQINDTLVLSTVEIPSTRLPVYSPGGKVQTIDSAAMSAYRHKNIADLLANNSSVLIRDYGTGNSSLISIRGLEPRQSQVSWNGFNLNSASLGMTDASLIPVAALDNASIAFGTHSTTFGTSALGGVVMIGNDIPEFNQSTSANIYTHYGSFGSINSGIDLLISGKRIESRTKVFYGASDNDFEFRNTALKDNPITNQTNSDFSYYGLLQTFSFKLNTNDLFEAGLWYQVYDRNIPPVMTVPESSASQKDSTIRGYLKYRHSFRNSVLTVSGAIMNDDQNYNDPEHLIRADYDIVNTFAQADHVWNITRDLIWSAGISVQSSSADFAEYAESQVRNTAGIHTGIRAKINERFTGSVSLRKEYTNIEDPPLIIRGELQYQSLGKTLGAHISGGNHFNLPTLNDLFWVPGGNTSLDPEKGYTAEAGTRIKLQDALPEFSVTGFFMQVNNWIKWFPRDNGLYNAENISEVRSTGIEFSLTNDIKTGPLAHRAEIRYTYCSTQTLNTDEPFADDTEGKQLIYVPEHSGGFNWMVAWKNLTMRYSHRYTGRQYINPDNTSELDPFQVADLQMEMKVQIKQHLIAFHFDINNLWNEQYQVIAWRAMPGIWYQAGVNLQLTKTKNND